MTQLLIDRATLEQLVVALEGVEALIEHQYTCTREGMNALQNASDDAQAAITAGRAALANAEPTGFSLTNTATGSLTQRIESIFETVDKEVAAGRLVRTGPLEWSKPK